MESTDLLGKFCHTKGLIGEALQTEVDTTACYTFTPCVGTFTGERTYLLSHPKNFRILLTSQKKINNHNKYERMLKIIC